MRPKVLGEQKQTVDRTGWRIGQTDFLVDSSLFSFYNTYNTKQKNTEQKSTIGEQFEFWVEFDSQYWVWYWLGSGPVGDDDNFKTGREGLRGSSDSQKTYPQRVSTDI